MIVRSLDFNELSLLELYARTTLMSKKYPPSCQVLKKAINLRGEMSMKDKLEKLSLIQYGNVFTFLRQVDTWISREENFCALIIQKLK